VGTAHFLEAKGVDLKGLPAEAGKLERQGLTCFFVAKGDKALGLVAVADLVREDAREAVARLKGMGLRVTLLSGDSFRTTMAVAEKMPAIFARASQAAASIDLVDERLELYRLDAQGALVARTSVAHPPSALESFREVHAGKQSRGELPGHDADLLEHARKALAEQAQQAPAQEVLKLEAMGGRVHHHRQHAPVEALQGGVFGDRVGHDLVPRGRQLLKLADPPLELVFDEHGQRLAKGHDMIGHLALLPDSLKL
jgi:hypothetical protein